MTTGTNHFVSYGAAGRYYKSYNPGFSPEELQEFVLEKVRAGEIVVGLPKAKLSELRIDADGRYSIVN